jgi:hypothetical protein
MGHVDLLRERIDGRPGEWPCEPEELPDREPTTDFTRGGESVGAASSLARMRFDGHLGDNAASIRATVDPLAKVESAVAVVLVEGISDQIALETAAVGRGRDLDAERVVIVPIGGAHAIGSFHRDTLARPLDALLTAVGPTTT